MMVQAKLHHILNYKDLFLVLVWREFSLKYKQTALGIAWTILQPLSYMALFTFIFTYAMPTKISLHPYPIFFFIAIMPWTFFANSAYFSVYSITTNYYMLRKIYFPPILLPLAGITTAFIDFLITSILFIGLIAYYKIHLSIYTLWYLPLLVLLIIFTLTMSLLLATLNVFYKDVGLISGFFIQIFFFATPIFYSINHIHPKFKKLIYLNPLTFIIENMRTCLLDAKTIDIWQYTIVFFILIIALLIAYKFFRSTEIKFADLA